MTKGGGNDAEYIVFLKDKNGLCKIPYCFFCIWRGVWEDGLSFISLNIWFCRNSQLGKRKKAEEKTYSYSGHGEATKERGVSNINHALEMIICL